MVGRALKQLLRSAGYSARFLTEASLDKAETLDGFELLLCAGGLDARRRSASSSILEDALAETNLPMLELIPSREGSREDGDGVLSWPCRAEELRERIEAILLKGSLGQGKEVSDGCG